MSLAIAQYVPAGPEIEKAPGDKFGGTVGFWHKGIAETVVAWLGIAYTKEFIIIPWLGHNEPFAWLSMNVPVNEDGDWTYYSVALNGVIPADAGQESSILDLFLGSGVNLDTYACVTNVGSQDPLTDDWDDDVYKLSQGGGIVGTLTEIMPMMLMFMMMAMIMPMMSTNQ